MVSEEHEKLLEEESIKESAFVSELIQLGLMYEEDIQKKGLVFIKELSKQKVFYFKSKKKSHKYQIGSLGMKDVGNIRRVIDSSIRISEVAELYGFKVKNNKIICPFHQDKDPSLSLNDVGNCFYCFGCNATGDIVEFVRRLKEVGCKLQKKKHKKK